MTEDEDIETGFLCTARVERSAFNKIKGFAKDHARNELINTIRDVVSNKSDKEMLDRIKIKCAPRANTGAF